MMEKFIKIWESICYFIQNSIWNNISDIDALISVIVIFGSGFLGFVSMLKRGRLNRYLRKWLPKDILKSLKYYIDTNGQQIDPCEHDEIIDTNSYKITTKLIPYFTKKVFKNNIQNQFFIILGDSGMGKTTFMVQLFKTYRRSISKKYNIEYIPLLYKDCLLEISNIENQVETILLLDGLDENPDALDNYENFMKELLEKTERFYKVIITCRTQFFPNEKAEPCETGRIRFDINNKRNLFHKIYVSPFSDDDIKRFLKKKYPFIFNKTKRRKAQEVISKTPYLMVRPMLLSYIDDLLQDDIEYEYIYQIYEQLTQKWIHREIIADEKLDRFTRKTALYMYDKGVNYIASQDIADICNQTNINLREIEAKSRSLLNRNGLGDYKFAHKSIYEYILAKEAMYNIDFRKRYDFSKLDMAKLFFQEMSSIYIKERIQDSIIVTGDFTKMDINDVNFCKKKYISATFEGANINNCYFHGCYMPGKKFNECSFSNCILTNAILAEETYEGVIFLKCTFSNAVCRETKFLKCSFLHCDMRKMNLIGAYMEDCFIIESNLTSSDLSYAKLDDCEFKSAILAPLEYDQVRCNPELLNEIRLANSVAKMLVSSGNWEAKENGVRIITNSSVTTE